MRQREIYTVESDECMCCACAGQVTRATTTLIARGGEYGHLPPEHDALYECPLCEECAKQHTEPTGDDNDQ